MSFIPNAVAALSAGSLSDPLTPGLTINVTSGGKKVWRLKRRVPARDHQAQPSRNAGAIVKLTGGSFPATNIHAARQWAQALNAEIERWVHRKTRGL